MKTWLTIISLILGIIASSFNILKSEKPPTERAGSGKMNPVLPDRPTPAVPELKDYYCPPLPESNSGARRVLTDILEETGALKSDLAAQEESSQRL